MYFVSTYYCANYYEEVFYVTSELQLPEAFSHNVSQCCTMLYICERIVES